MVDDDNVRFLGGSTHVVGKTATVGAAALRTAETRVGTYFRPKIGITTHVETVVFGNVARLGLLGPNDQGQGAQTFVFGKDHIDIGQCGMPPVEANVIAATFEQDITKGYFEGAFEIGQVFEKELFLEVLGIG